MPKKKGIGNPGAGRDAAHQCEPLDARLEREAVGPSHPIHRFRAVTSTSNPGRKTRVQLVAVASSAVEDEVYWGLFARRAKVYLDTIRKTKHKYN